MEQGLVPHRAHGLLAVIAGTIMTTKDRSSFAKDVYDPDSVVGSPGSPLLEPWRPTLSPDSLGLPKSEDVRYDT